MIMSENKNERTLALKQFLLYLVSSSDTQITDIITEMRALKGVVTISIFESTKSLSETKHFTKLKLKYLQYSNNLKENIKLLKKEILQVSGVVSVNLKIKKSDILDISKTDQRRENES